MDVTDSEPELDDRGERSDGDGEAEASSPCDDGFDAFLAALASSPPPYRPPKLQPGQMFDDRYLVERELGRGGMGTVYLAQDLELQRKVALKVAAGRRTEVELARLQQEAKVMAQLSHAGIVTVFEAKAVGEGIYLALEFVPGGTVRDWFDVQPRSWREVVAMFIDIAQALSEAHDAGVVHRDFKPHNVLLGLDGKPRIADFGLARSSRAQTSMTASIPADSTLTTSGAVLGTPAYMAPEQAEGEEVTAQGDQFSFFVSLYEGICGRRPFSGPTLAAVLEQIEQGAPRDFPAMPRSLAQVIRRGLAYEASARHPDMAAVATALQRVATARRRRLQTVALAVGAAVAASVGFIAAPKRAEPCAPQDVFASIDGLWTPSVQSAVRSGSGDDAARRIDAQADALRNERVSACEAHRVESTLSDEDFALTGACLDRLEGRLAGLIDDLTGHPHEEPALGMGDVLSDPARCRDRQALRRAANAFAPVSSLSNPRDEEVVYDALRSLTRVTLQVQRGEDVGETLDALESLAKDKDLPDLESHALLLRAAGEDDPLRIAALLDRAQVAADRTDNTELLSTLALRRSHLALLFGDLDLAQVHLDHADTLARLSVFRAASDARSVESESARLQLAVARGDTKSSIDGLRALRAKVPAHSVWALHASSLLADALADRGRYAEADATYAQALAHPDATDPQRRLALHLNRALARLETGDPAAAERSIDAAVAASADPDELGALVRAPIALARARVALQRGDLGVARTHAAVAEQVLSELDAHHPGLAYVFDTQSEIAAASDALDDAVALGKRALAMWDAVNGPGSADFGRTITILAPVLVRQGRREKAAEIAQRAIGMLEDAERPADEVALARFALADALESTDPAGSAKALSRARRDCASSERAECKALSEAGTSALLGAPHEP